MDREIKELLKRLPVLCCAKCVWWDEPDEPWYDEDGSVCWEWNDAYRVKDNDENRA